jgi:ABC-type glycerol-3-phosphate transport system permease component
MFLVALLNCLLGTICGFRFRATIIVPLLAVALIEVSILKHIGEWSSAFWLTIVLITTLEMGYLIGSVVDALWLTLGRELLLGGGSVLRNFWRRGGSR